jgi:hypothetical protein
MLTRLLKFQRIIMGSRRLGDTNGPELLSPEDFQAELALLGLSGREFGTREYAEILGETLEMEITICVLPDDHYPELTRKMARAGKLAELTYSTNPLGAVILVPSSLPPIVRTLSVYHELGHVAAGHPVEVWEGGAKTGRLEHVPRRLARRPPVEDRRLCEQEADLRAVYSLLAGSLGLRNYYAEKMYDPL